MLQATHDVSDSNSAAGFDPLPIGQAAAALRSRRDQIEIEHTVPVAISTHLLLAMDMRQRINGIAAEWFERPDEEMFDNVLEVQIGLLFRSLLDKLSENITSALIDRSDAKGGA